MPSFHSKRSPSRADTFLACAGSIAVTDALSDIYKNLRNEAAERGTATHGLVEHCLKRKEEPEAYIDRIIELVGEEQAVSILRAGAKLPGRDRVFFIVDSDMIDSATTMTKYVRDRCLDLGIDEDAIQTETRTNPCPTKPAEETSGTADTTLDAWPDLLEVVDFKNGYLTVDHRKNNQLRAYLVGKAHDTGWRHKRYRVTVVQPNADHAEGPIRFEEYTAKELKKFQAEYLAGVERSEEASDDPDAPKKGFNRLDDDWAKRWLVAGTDQCFWCEAAPICPARLQMAADEAGEDFNDDPAESTQEVHDMDGAVRVLAWADNMERLIAQARAFGQRTLEAGFDFPEHKLVRGRSNREWTEDLSPETIAARLVKQGFVKDKTVLFSPPKLLTAPQAEKLVPRDKRKKFNELFVTKPEGKLTMVHESDSREAVDANPANDFPDEDMNDDDDFG